MRFSKEEIINSVCTSVKEKLKEAIDGSGVKCYCHRFNRHDLYICLGPIDTSRQAITLLKTTDTINKVPEILFIARKDDKLKLTTNLSLKEYGICSIEPEPLFNILDVVVRDSQLSGKVFGRSDLKQTLVGTRYKGGSYTVDYGNSKKLEQETYYINIPTNEVKDGKKVFVKFVMSEVIFVLPDLKGYSIPKDKTIYSGDKVKLIFDKFGEPWTVTNVESDGTSKKICRNSKNRQKDIVTIKKNGMSKQVFAKYLKKV